MPSQSTLQFELELPVGFTDDDGTTHKTARLHKLTGREEALLADRKLRKNGGKLVTEVIASCMDKLGDVEKVTPQVASKLTSADRNYLLLELRKKTFGNEIETQYTCPGCGNNIRASEDLDQFEVTRTNGSGAPDICVELEDGYADRDGGVFTDAMFRLPTGIDEERIAGAMKRNPAHGVNALLARCMIELDGMPDAEREALGTQIISSLTMSDRARIEQAMAKASPGVDLKHEIECDACSHEFKVTLDMTSFFSLQ